MPDSNPRQEAAANNSTDAYKMFSTWQNKRPVFANALVDVCGTVTSYSVRHYAVAVFVSKAISISMAIICLGNLLEKVLAWALFHLEMKFF